MGLQVGQRAGPCASENDTRGVCTGALRVRHHHLGQSLVCVPGLLPLLPGLPGWTCMATLASSGWVAPHW